LNAVPKQEPVNQQYGSGHQQTDFLAIFKPADPKQRSPDNHQPGPQVPKFPEVFPTNPYPPQVVGYQQRPDGNQNNANNE
jgi:hypothetical protein